MNAPPVAPTSPTVPVPQRPGIPGKYVVLGMFVMGLISTATIFLYWDLHTGPFRPLTEALGRELPRSLPKVEGGSSKGGPNTLRIALRVGFEPDAAKPETQDVVNQVVQLARKHAALGDFELLQVHLLQLAPERFAKQLSLEYSAPEMQNHLPFPPPSEQTTPE